MNARILMPSVKGDVKKKDMILLNVILQMNVVKYISCSWSFLNLNCHNWKYLPCVYVLPRIGFRFVKRVPNQTIFCTADSKMVIMIVKPKFMCHIYHVYFVYPCIKFVWYLRAILCWDLRIVNKVGLCCYLLVWIIKDEIILVFGVCQYLFLLPVKNPSIFLFLSMYKIIFSLSLIWGIIEASLSLRLQLLIISNLQYYLFCLPFL